MISKFDIENKDYSLALPAVAHKLTALETLCVKIEDEHGDRAISGIIYILLDCVDDLDVINEALYPSKKEDAASGETAP